MVCVQDFLKTLLRSSMLIKYIPNASNSSNPFSSIFNNFSAHNFGGLQPLLSQAVDKQGLFKAILDSNQHLLLFIAIFQFKMNLFDLSFQLVNDLPRLLNMVHERISAPGLFYRFIAKKLNLMKMLIAFSFGISIC